jgi:dTDP-glucose pyrophosphorylase/CBS domain-containing protein
MQLLQVTPGISIREAMVSLDRTAEKCLFIVDSNDILIGTLTDGDVRRAILSGARLDEAIEGYFHSSPLKVTQVPGEDPGAVDRQAINIMKSRRVEVVPVVDPTGRVSRYVTWGDIFSEPRADARPPLGIPVIIMAGGYGTRLEPFTKVLPKPLIPVNDKPIIEHIIERFVEHGADDFRLTVNYKNRIIKAYFEDQRPSYGLSFVDESEPMGTAGSLHYLNGKVSGPIFVTNCDIIIHADYRHILEHHRRNGHAVTLVGSAVHYEIPYGTCVLDESGHLAALHEKPSYDFLVNTGMYVVEADTLSMIPSEGVYHMTDLIADAIKAGRTVGVFPVSEDAWIDIGQWKEYERATERL